MPLNKANVLKAKNQHAEYVYNQRMRDAATERTDPRYDVYDHASHLVAQHKTLIECVPYGFGHKFVPVED
jgi:gluconate kinase